MVVKIRLARFGRRHAPFYNIVVAQARTARNSKPLEVIGTYDPIPRAPPAAAQTDPLQPASSDPQAQAAKKAKNAEGLEGTANTSQVTTPTPPNKLAPPRKQKDVRLDVDRAKYWLGVGAQPSDAAWKILSMVGLVEPKWRVGVRHEREGLLDAREEATKKA